MDGDPNPEDLDELEDFALHFGLTSKVAPVPVAVLQETEDSPEGLLPEKIVRQDTPEEALKDLWETFPNASREFVLKLVSASPKGYISGLVTLMRAKTRLGVGERCQRFLTEVFRKGYIDTSEIPKLAQDRSFNGKVKPEYTSVTKIPSVLRKRGIHIRKTAIGEGQYRYQLDPQSFEGLKPPRNLYTREQRKEVFRVGDYQCAICDRKNPDLEVDHRIPFAVVSDSVVEREGLSALQPLCHGDNTRKQTDCGKCKVASESMCRTCYWAYPKGAYTHKAGKPVS